MFFFSFLLLATIAVALAPLPINPCVGKPQLMEEILKDLPRGVRFAPHPEELICDLLEKNRDHNHTILTMPVVNLNEVEPWDAISITKEGEDCYLLWKQDKRYERGSRICRTTERGYWKSTGNDTPIYSHEETGSKIIGMKKNLVFYLGKAPSSKNTKWVMKEFRVDSSAFPDQPTPNPWVVALITYSGKNNGQERMDPTVVRGLTVDTTFMEPSCTIATTIPAPDGASGSWVPHSDIGLLPPLIDVSESSDVPKKALNVMADKDAPNYAYECHKRMDGQAEQPPWKKIKGMACSPGADIMKGSPTSVLVTGSHFSSRETMHDFDQFSTSSDKAAYYDQYFYEAPPNLADFLLPGPSITK